MNTAFLCEVGFEQEKELFRPVPPLRPMEKVEDPEAHDYDDRNTLALAQRLPRLRFVDWERIRVTTEKSQPK